MNKKNFLYFELIFLITLVFVNIKVIPVELNIEKYCENYSPKRTIFYDNVVQELNSLNLQQDDDLFIKYDKFKNINNDVCAWIHLEGYNVDNPVVYSGDNSSYLRTDIYGKYNTQGTIFFDEQFNIDSIIKIIHGHNTKRRGMFTALPTLLKKETLDDEPYIELYYNNSLHNYKIVSVITMSSFDKLIDYQTYYSEKELLDIKNKFVDESILPVTDVPEGVEFLLLDTCYYGISGCEHNLHFIVFSILV